jgi:hypothetical protein
MIYKKKIKDIKKLLAVKFLKKGISSIFALMIVR